MPRVVDTYQPISARGRYVMLHAAIAVIWSGAGARLEDNRVVCAREVKEYPRRRHAVQGRRGRQHV
eukprot:993872-Lingulodinium_polyedra.AAC.1